MSNDHIIHTADAKVLLKKGEGRTIKAGGLWVFDNEIASISGSFENGDIITVHDFDDFFLGYGFINTNSKIRIRLMSRSKANPVTPELIETRVRNAWNYRKEVIDTGCCRMIFGEADFLPGITIDKFSEVLVVESLALGTDLLKPLILDACQKVLAEDDIIVRGIYERSDAKVREHEGMERFKGFIAVPGMSTPAFRPTEKEYFTTNVEIIENGVKYMVDVKEGQKTGFFLDQKNNRASIRKLCKGKRVLDCFTHTGSFALNAAAAGAVEVLGVDASDVAIDQARINAKLNNVQDRVSFEVADVFDLLPQLEEKGEKYDVVVLDPPAFTKSRNSIKNAAKGYREINLRGCHLVKDGGYLVTCSCSHFMDPENFAKVIHEAANSAHVRLRQVEFHTQAPDHPILWADDASYYLKFYIFQVVHEM